VRAYLLLAVFRHDHALGIEPLKGLHRVAVGDHLDQQVNIILERRAPLQVGKVPRRRRAKGVPRGGAAGGKREKKKKTRNIVSLFAFIRDHSQFYFEYIRDHSFQSADAIL
jgi:hypothetical protein